MNFFSLKKLPDPRTDSGFTGLCGPLVSPSRSHVPDGLGHRIAPVFGQYTLVKYIAGIRNTHLIIQFSPYANSTNDERGLRTREREFNLSTNNVEYDHILVILL